MENENMNSLISYSQFILTNGEKGTKQNLAGLDIRNFRLEEADFDGMILSESSFKDGEFIVCYLGAMYITNCKFENVNFVDTNFRKVEFYYSEFVNCTFQNSLFLRGSIFNSKIIQTTFSNCDFTDALFSNNEVEKTTTENCIKSETTLIDI